MKRNFDFDRIGKRLPYTVRTVFWTIWKTTYGKL